MGQTDLIGAYHPPRASRLLDGKPDKYSPAIVAHLIPHLIVANKKALMFP